MAQRVRKAIDSWDRPSAMTDDLASCVAFTLAGGALEDGLDAALVGVVGRAWPDDKERAGQLRTADAQREWFREVTARDRLAAWKVGLRARLITERLVAAIFGDEATLKRCRVVEKAMKRWTALDEIPAVVGAEIAWAMMQDARPAAMKAAVERLAPAPAARRGKEGYLEQWVYDLAREEPVLAMKVALEALIRSGKGVTEPEA